MNYLTARSFLHSMLPSNVPAMLTWSAATFPRTIALMNKNQTRKIGRVGAAEGEGGGSSAKWHRWVTFHGGPWWVMYVTPLPSSPLTGIPSPQHTLSPRSTVTNMSRTHFRGSNSKRFGDVRSDNPVFKGEKKSRKWSVIKIQQ